MSTVSSMRKIKQRVSELDWQALEQSLWECGYAKTPPLLSSQECKELVQLYPDDTRFRSRIDMADTLWHMKTILAKSQMP